MDNTWETTSGLIDDIDGYITNPRFGFREQYIAVAGEAVLFMFDLVDEDGNLISNPEFPPAYSVGAGWLVKENGTRIERPEKPKIIRTSMYGRLIDRVVKDLKVPMHEYGSAFEAKSWDGLGFHWRQEEHTTVGGETKTHLMPTSFLGKKGIKQATATGQDELISRLTKMASLMDRIEFQKEAILIPEVKQNPRLMSQILDDSDKGFWAQARRK